MHTHTDIYTFGYIYTSQLLLANLFSCHVTSSGQLVQDILEKELPVKDINECKIPFGCTAYSIFEAKTKLIHSGDMATSVRASACFPVMFQPVMMDGYTYIHTYIHLHTYLRTYIHAYICINTYKYTYVYVNTHAYT